MFSSPLKQHASLCRWHRQIASRDWRRLGTAPTDYAAVGYHLRNQAHGDLVRLGDLTMVVLAYERARDSTPAIRLSGFRGNQIPWGVEWGGTGNSVFEKNLNLRPARGARGHRLDFHRRLLRLGRNSDRRV